MPRGTFRLAVLLVALGFAVPEAVIVGTRHPSTRFEVESNNTAAVATPLNITGPYGVGAGAIGSAGDVDYWSFPASVSAYVSILCDTGGVQSTGATSRRVSLELIGPTGEILESDIGDGTGNGGDGTVETDDAAAITFRALPTGGIFYVRVSGLTATDLVAPYRLFVAITPFARGPEVEPNDEPSSASPIAMSTSFGVRVGTIEPGDEDHFSVRAQGGEQLFFALMSQSDLVVEVQDNGGTRLLTVDSATTGSSADPPGEAANLSLPGPGRYVLKVRHASAEARGFYVLLVILRPFTDGAADFDGDFRIDPSVYSPAGIWTIFHSTSSPTTQPSIELNWGDPALGDIPVPADYDGDGTSDVAVYRVPTGEWRLRGPNGEETIVQWGNGMVGDLPIPGDYDGDRRCDLAVYRRTAGDWFIRFARGGAATVRWGAPWLDDVPVPADYDGDGTTDVAVYRNATGEWFVAYSSGGLGYTGWGAPWLGDIPVPGDYDGDSIADVAVYRRSTAGWFIRHASGGETWYSWGGAGTSDIPLPGDYDGDGVTDVAIYRGPPDVFLVRMSYTLGLMARPINGSGNLPVNFSTAVRLLALP